MYLNSLSGIYITSTRFILQLFLYIFLKVLGTSWTLRQQFGTIVFSKVGDTFVCTFENNNRLHDDEKFNNCIILNK